MYRWRLSRFSRNRTSRGRQIGFNVLPSWSDYRGRRSIQSGAAGCWIVVAICVDGIHSSTESPSMTRCTYEVIHTVCTR